MVLKFNVKVSFIHKESMSATIIAKNGFDALNMALEDLSSVEKDNIKGANITYISQKQRGVKGDE